MQLVSLSRERKRKRKRKRVAPPHKTTAISNSMYRNAAYNPRRDSLEKRRNVQEYPLGFGTVSRQQQQERQSGHAPSGRGLPRDRIPQATTERTPVRRARGRDIVRADDRRLPKSRAEPRQRRASPTRQRPSVPNSRSRARAPVSNRREEERVRHIPTPPAERLLQASPAKIPQTPVNKAPVDPVPQRKEPEELEVVSEDGETNAGIYPAEADRFCAQPAPSKASVVTFEVRLPVYDTSEPSEDGSVPRDEEVQPTLEDVVHLRQSFEEVERQEVVRRLVESADEEYSQHPNDMTREESLSDSGEEEDSWNPDGTSLQQETMEARETEQEEEGKAPQESMEISSGPHSADEVENVRIEISSAEDAAETDSGNSSLPEDTLVPPDDEESSEDPKDDFDNVKHPYQPGEFEGEGEMKDALKNARDVFSEVMSSTKRYHDLAMYERAAFRGKRTIAENRIQMSRENLNAFRDTVMHAMAMELLAQCRTLKLDESTSLEDFEAVRNKLSEMIEAVKENAAAYQKNYYENLFLPSILNRVVRKAIYPFLKVPEDEDGLPNYLNPMGKLIEFIVPRGILSMEVSGEPFQLDWNDWKLLDKKKLCEELVLKSLKDTAWVLNASKTRDEERNTCRSVLACALTGIAIFPGDMIHVARIVRRASTKNVTEPLEDRTHCLLFHAEIEQYVRTPGRRMQCGEEDMINEDEESDDEDGEDIEERASAASRSIIVTLLNSLSIIADSYYASGLKRNFSKTTTLWFKAQGRALLASALMPPEDIQEVTEAAITVNTIVASMESLQYFIEHTLMQEAHLNTLGRMYAQHMLAIYNLRHLLGMN